MLLLLKEYPAISKFPHRLKRSHNPFQDVLLGFASVLIFFGEAGLSSSTADVEAELFVVLLTRPFQSR